MSKSYYRKPEMFSGGPFRCYNCNKMMIAHLSGSVYEVDLECPRCKVEIHIKCNEPIPFIEKQLDGQKQVSTTGSEQ